MCKKIWRRVKWLIDLPNAWEAYIHDKAARAFGLDLNPPAPRLRIGPKDTFLIRWPGQNTNSQVRAARIRLNGGTFTKRDWERLLRRDRCCLRCGATEQLSMDHVVPVALGGRHAFNNAQVLCRSCNSWKSTKTIDYRKRF